MTTEKIRELTEVFDVQETDKIISIGYFFGGIREKANHLVVDKTVDKWLMVWVNGKCSQWDAINICVAFEKHRLENEGRTQYFHLISRPINDQLN